MHDEQTTARDRLNAQEGQDKMRFLLSRKEDEILGVLTGISGSDETNRWLAIARTHIQQGFMAAKRAVYEGKRVGD